MRLNPHFPEYYLFVLGAGYTFTEQYEESIAAHKRALTRNPDFLASHVALAFLYSVLGREEARAEVKEVLRINPGFSLEVARQRMPFRNQEDREGFLGALAKAGLK